MIERVMTLLRVSAMVMLLSLIGGMFLLASIRSQTQDNARELARVLANDIGQRICDHSALPRNEILKTASEWTAARTEAVEVTLQLGSEPAVKFQSSPWQAADDTVQATADMTVIRDGAAWGRLNVLVAPPKSGPVGGLDSHPLFGGAIGACVLVLAWTASVSRARNGATGFSGLWADARHRVVETMDFLAEGIVVLDPRGRIVFANRALGDGIEVASSSLTGVSIDSLGFRRSGESPDGGEISRGWFPWPTLVADPSARVRGQVAWESGGRTRVFNVSGRAIITRRRTRGIVLTFDDVTMLERQRHDLQIARDIADRANQAKSVFLANMSHEIRTPINGVMGTLELLDRTPLKSRQRQFLHGAQDSASALLRLINDILDLSKLEAGKLELCEVDFDLEECALSALRVISPAASSKGLELVLAVGMGADLKLKGDPERLRQVLINLTANAAKFTSEGEVHVLLTAAQADADARVSVRVRDTGIGIPPDRLDRLFKSFSQVDSSTSRKFGGTGLGLAISKQLIEMMHGSISVSSEVGVGSEFSFEITLPIAATLPTASERPEMAWRDRRMFVALEPCASAAEALRFALDTAELHHIVLSSEEGFVERVGTAGAEEIITIIGTITWTSDCTAIARRLRERSSTARILAMTLTAPDPAIEQSLSSGNLINGWLRKPCGPRDLIRQLTAALDRQEEHMPDHTELVFDASDAAGKRVLIAEDNPVGQLVTREFVESIGLQTSALDRGDLVLQAALSERFDVILMDCHLPELDGFEVTRRIRNHEQANSLKPAKIIALTASAMQGDRERCLAAGMDSYVSKPVSRAELSRAIADMLGVALVRPVPESSGQSPASAQPSSSRGAAAQGAPLNVKELHARCLRQPALIEQLLQLFQSTTDQDLMNLSTAVSENDNDRASEIAHSIAGCALQVGASQLAALAKQIEIGAPAASMEVIECELDKLKAEFARCIEFLPNAVLPQAAVEIPPVSKNSAAPDDTGVSSVHSHRQ